MTVMTALKNTVPGMLVLLGVLGSGCAIDAQAQSTMKMSEDHQRQPADQGSRTGVLTEDEVPFKVSFECSTVAPGTIFAELSWPVESAAAFSTTTRRLSVTTEHDGFESGSYGEIQISDVEPFNVQAPGSTDQQDYKFARTIRGQSITVRRNNAIMQRSTGDPIAIELEPGQPNTANVDQSMDFPTRLLAQLRVVGGEFDSRSTAPRGTVTMVGLEANVAYRFRLTEGSQSGAEHVFVAPVCVTDSVGPRPE